MLESVLNYNEEKPLNFESEKKSTSYKNLPSDLLEAINDSRSRKNLNGPFETAEDAVKSMLED